MLPASKMLTPDTWVMSMPPEPEITPELTMPPVKVLPAMSMANGAVPPTISPPLEITMPWLVATMAPESTIAPLIVPSAMSMAVFAEMVPPRH